MLLPTHHICLVAESPMPTLGPLLDQAVGAGSATLVHTNYTKKFAEYQAVVLKHKGIKTQLFSLTDAYHLPPIIAELTDLASQYPEGACVNITGGSKLMSIAAWQVFNQPQHHLYYVHLHHDSMVWLNQAQPDHPIADTIKLPEYFAAHGYLITGHSATPAHPSLMQLARFFAQGTHQAELQHLIQLAVKERQAGNNLFRITYPNHKKMQTLVERIVAANIATIKNNQLHLADANAWRFINGEWLEQYTLDCINQLKSQYRKFQDVALGLKVTNPTLKFSAPESNNMQSLSNELDIVVLRDNTLYLIECKAGRNFPDQADNYTSKLDSLRDTLGGIKGKGLLISQYALNPSSEKRAHEYHVKTLSGSAALKNLKPLLAEWLDCN